MQGDGKAAPVVFLARADRARFEPDDALDILHHAVEGRLRQRIFRQRAGGVVQHFQRHVGPRELLGFLLHPRFERGVAAR